MSLDLKLPIRVSRPKRLFLRTTFFRRINLFILTKFYIAEEGAIITAENLQLLTHSDID